MMPFLWGFKFRNTEFVILVELGMTYLSAQSKYANAIWGLDADLRWLHFNLPFKYCPLFDCV